MDRRVVIVGASHAGVAMADALRREGYDGEVILISREDHAPYQRPLLSKSPDLLDLPAERVAIRQPSFFADGNIDLVLGADAAEIDPQADRVILADGRTIAYDHLVLATGARARTLPPELISGTPPLTIRSLDEALALRHRLRDAKSLAIIGGGLIGLEIAALANRSGLAVTVIEATDRVMSRIVPPSVSAAVLDRHARSGIAFHLNAAVTAVKGSETGYVIETKDGTITADVVLVSIGTISETTLAERAGLAIADGIAVSTQGETSVPSIWAIGDCAAWQLPETRTRFEGIQPATEQAKIVARAIIGKPFAGFPVPRFWSHQGDLKLQMVGIAPAGATFVRHRRAEAGAFCELAIASDRVAACFAIDAPTEFRNAVRLIEKSTPVPDGDVVGALLHRNGPSLGR